ncbi:hypothetical protein MNBD_GAMMA15-2497 [hydrothermal vent metagenome]|uniref:MobA-like NTP transferase domain-containing protein n=1 Tax=hydrothermal vent metagenome TaxID=652676 RepID=A0A3B0YI57_9ZZZZ
MTIQNPLPHTEVSLLILAGGEGRRMNGQDKGLMSVAGKPAIEHLLDRFSGHPGPVIISANRNLKRYANYGYPVIKDNSGDFRGPLAGMLAGLMAASGSHVLTLPVDAPLIDEHYPARMISALAGNTHKACVASLDQRIEPVFCLLDKTLAPGLKSYLDRGERTVNGWLNEIDALAVDFSDLPRQFINLNTTQDQELIHERHHR